MIGIERLKLPLGMIAASQYVANGMGPLSAVLIAPSDSGKTELMLAHLPRHASVINDFTFASLLKEVTAARPPIYLVVPDLNIALNHKPAVANLATALMLALIAEGITKIPGVSEHDLARAKQLRARGLRFAFLTGMTPELFHGKRGKWRETGLLRRLIPINYTYSRLTEIRIQQHIRDGSDLLKYAHDQQPTYKRRAIEIPAPLREDLMMLSEQVTTRQLVWQRRDEHGRAHETKGVVHPFSTQKVLRQLARAEAMRADHGEVTREDVAGVFECAKFIRHDRPEEI